MTPCPRPTPFETLVAWWTDGLSEAEALAVEEHLFTCDTCAAASEGLTGLVGALREAIPPVISRRHFDRLAARGTRVRVTPVEPGVAARARFGPDVDLLVHVLRADLSRAERVDLDAFTQEGAPLVALEHVPFDPATGEVLVACQRHYQRFGDPIFRLHTVEGGERRPVGEYFVAHTWE